VHDTASSASVANAREVVWHRSPLPRLKRWQAVGGFGATVWLTGLSGSGKSSVAVELEQLLIEQGKATCLLDGDNLRHGLNSDLGFSVADRDENIRRVSEVARLIADAGLVALVPVISPYRAARQRAREIHEAAELAFVEVFVDTPLEVCEQRDPKGMYAKARAGEIKDFTGIDDPYEPPASPEVHLRMTHGNPQQQAKTVLEALQSGLVS